MPQPVSNTTTIVSVSLLANKISYVVDGQGRDYRGGYGGLSWMSEAEATNNVIFIGNTSTIGRGPADKPLFYPSFNTSDANIIYAANTLPGSPRNLSTVAGAYGWAANNNFFINSANSPIPRIDADGLVLYVDANQPTSYPQTNNDWFDLSGFGNNGTLTNGPSWNSRGYFEFDGADDYVNCGNGSSLNILRTVTMELWFNVSGFGSPWTNVFGKMNADGDSNTRCYTAFINSSGYVHFVTADSSGQEHLDSTNFISTGVWYHWVGTINRNTGVLNQYVNGTLNSTGGVRTTDIVTNSDPLRIGYAGNYYQRYNGLVSFGRIYNKALTLSEIKQNYFQGNIVTDGLVFMIDANNLVSYPRSGTTLYNLTSSISTVTGSLINGPTYGVENGGSIVFDGVDDYIDFNNLAGTLISNPSLNSNIISFSCWVLVSNPGSYYIISSGGQTSSTGVAFSYQNGSPFVSIQGTNFSVSISISTSDFPLNTWINFAFVGNGSNLTVYKNGVYLNVGSYGVTVLSDTETILSLGRPNNFTGLTLGGKLAQVMFYSKALTPSEVQQNYEATKYKFQGQQIITNGLVAYVDATNKDSYPGTGTTWYDLSGNGNNFTFSSTPNMAGGLFDSEASVFAYRNAIAVNSSTNGYTLEACFKLNSSTGGSWQNITQNGGGDPTRHIMWYNGGSNTLQALFHTPNSYNNISDTLSLNTWYYVQLSYNPSGGGSNGRRAWINGVEKTVNNTAAGNATPSGYFTISVDSDLASNKSDASYAFVRYYNRALSEAEILQNYNAQRTRFGI